MKASKMTFVILAIVALAELIVEDSSVLKSKKNRKMKAGKMTFVILAIVALVELIVEDSSLLKFQTYL